MKLVLAVDTSRSMDQEEVRHPAGGHVEALKHKDSSEAVTEGSPDALAISYFEWAGYMVPGSVIDWHVIETEQDAIDLPACLSRDQSPRSAARRSPPRLPKGCNDRLQPLFRHETSDRRLRRRHKQFRKPGCASPRQAQWRPAWSSTDLRSCCRPSGAPGRTRQVLCRLRDWRPRFLRLCQSTRLRISLWQCAASLSWKSAVFLPPTMDGIADQPVTDCMVR